MSPRPKRTPDADLVTAATRVIAERGAAQTRLADVAAATGFAAATLVQRFGSRDGLLRAVADSHIAGIADAFYSKPEEPVSASASAPVSVYRHLGRLTAALQRLHAEAHFTFFLAFEDAAPAYSLELRKHIAFALAAAVEAGELPPCDVAMHARRIQIGYYGIAAAALLEGDEAVADAIRTLVIEILADFL